MVGARVSPGFFWEHVGGFVMKFNIFALGHSQRVFGDTSVSIPLLGPLISRDFGFLG